MENDLKTMEGVQLPLKYAKAEVDIEFIKSERALIRVYQSAIHQNDRKIQLGGFYKNISRIVTIKSNEG